MLDFEQKLKELGLTLPSPLPPSANYVPYVLSGNTIFLSGHGPRSADGTYRTGQLSVPEDIPRGFADSQFTALNMLATVRAAVGDLTRIKQIVKILGMVNAHPGFKHHSAVIDGCSNLLVYVFGDRGRHARSAVGMGSLPHDMSVEIEAIITLYS